MSEDPIGYRGKDENIYRYVKNNPLSLNDPLGLFGFGDVLDRGAGFLLSIVTGNLQVLTSALRVVNAELYYLNARLSHLRRLPCDSSAYKEIDEVLKQIAAANKEISDLSRKLGLIGTYKTLIKESIAKNLLNQAIDQVNELVKELSNANH